MNEMKAVKNMTSVLQYSGARGDVEAIMWSVVQQGVWECGKNERGRGEGGGMYATVQVKSRYGVRSE